MTETIEFGPMSVVDCAMRDPAHSTLLVELRERYVSSDRYPDYAVAAKKVDAMLRLSEELDAPAIIAVRYTDRDRYVVLHDDLPVERKIGGRTDRGDPSDREVMAHIPHSCFRDLI